MSGETITARGWLGAASWLAAAVGAGLLVVAWTAPLIDARGAIVVLVLPLGVGIARSLLGADRPHADRVHRGLVAAAWTATIVTGAIVAWVVAMVAFFWALFGGM